VAYKVSDNHPLHRFFSGAIENVFYGELGICSPELVEYLTTLLLGFVHVRDIYALKSASGEPLVQVADMVVRAYLGPGVPPEKRERLVHRHIGDFTLYWTGVYPESLAQHRSPESSDYMVDYYEQGRRSYAIASELSGPDDEPSASVLERLSDHFEYCSYGLTLARRAWDRNETS